MSADWEGIHTGQISSTYNVVDCRQEDESADSNAYTPPYVFKSNLNHFEILQQFPYKFIAYLIGTVQNYLETPIASLQFPIHSAQQ